MFKTMPALALMQQRVYEKQKEIFPINLLEDLNQKAFDAYLNTKFSQWGDERKLQFLQAIQNSFILRSKFRESLANDPILCADLARVNTKSRAETVEYSPTKDHQADVNRKIMVTLEARLSRLSKKDIRLQLESGELVGEQFVAEKIIGQGSQSIVFGGVLLNIDIKGKIIEQKITFNVPLLTDSDDFVSANQESQKMLRRNLAVNIMAGSSDEFKGGVVYGVNDKVPRGGKMEAEMINNSFLPLLRNSEGGAQTLKFSDIHFDSNLDLPIEIEDIQKTFAQNGGEMKLPVAPLGEGSLAEKMEQEQLSLPEILGVSLSLLNYLNFMHRRGIIHRDLKPENIVLKKEIVGGSAIGVKVIDHLMTAVKGTKRLSPEDLFKTIEKKTGKNLTNLENDAEINRFRRELYTKMNSKQLSKLDKNHKPSFQTGTPRYAHPNVLLSRKNKDEIVSAEQQDTYSLGIIIVEMLLGPDADKLFTGSRQKMDLKTHNAIISDALDEIEDKYIDQPTIIQGLLIALRQMLIIRPPAVTKYPEKKKGDKYNPVGRVTVFDDEIVGYTSAFSSKDVLKNFLNLPLGKLEASGMERSELATYLKPYLNPQVCPEAGLRIGAALRLMELGDIKDSLEFLIEAYYKVLQHKKPEIVQLFQQKLLANKVMVENYLDKTIKRYINDNSEKNNRSFIEKLNLLVTFPDLKIRDKAEGALVALGKRSWGSLRKSGIATQSFLDLSLPKYCELTARDTQAVRKNKKVRGIADILRKLADSHRNSAIGEKINGALQALREDYLGDTNTIEASTQYLETILMRYRYDKEARLNQKKVYLKQKNIVEKIDQKEKIARQELIQELTARSVGGNPLVRAKATMALINLDFNRGIESLLTLQQEVMFDNPEIMDYINKTWLKSENHISRVLHYIQEVTRDKGKLIRVYNKSNAVISSGINDNRKYIQAERNVAKIERVPLSLDYFAKNHPSPQVKRLAKQALIDWDADVATQINHYEVASAYDYELV